MLQTRLIQSGEECRCNVFHNTTYGKDRTIEQWYWEFNPGRSAEIPFVGCFSSDGEVIGTQALIPLKMINESGRIFLTAKSEETLVGEQSRGTGCFAQMYEKLFDWARDHDVEAIWGFTPARKAFENVGFRIPGHTGQLFMPLSRESVDLLTAKLTDRATKLTRRLLVRWGTRIGAPLVVGCTGLKGRAALRWRTEPEAVGLLIRTASNEVPDAAALCEAFVRQWGGCTLMRDADYLQWRFFRNPHVMATIRVAYLDGKPVGWIAYSVGNDLMGYIVDLIVASPSGSTQEAYVITRALLLDAVGRVVKTGAVGIRAWSVNNHAFDRLVVKVAKSIGFWHLPIGGPIVFWQPHGVRKIDFNALYMTRIYTEGVEG